MANAPSYTFASLQDFSALPSLREIVAGGSTEICLTGLPTLNAAFLVKEANRVASKELRLMKRDMLAASSPLPTEIVAFAATCHAISAAVFNNLSHVLELPWERYLNEMHEFAAGGADEIQLLPKGRELERAWSSLTLLFDSQDISTCRVIFGEALAVFSENCVKVGQSPVIQGAERGETHWIVYQVRPNDAVYYTRGAGALMTPLSAQEHSDRKRISEILEETRGSSQILYKL